MHHFVVPREAIDRDRIAFLPAQAHHIQRVLRLRDGDEVVALDGTGAQYRVRLTVDKRDVRGEIVGASTACHEPVRRVTLAVAPPRGERWDWLLQKGTEIGVARFVPLNTRYARPGAALVKPRHHQIVREATEQSRRLLVPVIDEPQALDDLLRAAADEPTQATVMVWEGAVEPALGSLLRATPFQEAPALRFIVGPEGGFHADEVSQAREMGIALASLGPSILRVETAALVAAALALVP